MANSTLGAAAAGRDVARPRAALSVPRSAAGHGRLRKAGRRGRVPARGGVSLRLPMIYGAFDRQRREEFMLRRVRAGRRRIPFGSGGWLACRGYVGEIARGVRLLWKRLASKAKFSTSPNADGADSPVGGADPRRRRFEAEPCQGAATAAARGSAIDRRDVTAPSDRLHRKRGDARLADMPIQSPGIEQSVRWHLEHPPEAESWLRADDRALAEAVQVSDRA